jgi:peroxiredoxin
MKKPILALCFAVLYLLPYQVAAELPPDAVRAFANAGLPLLRRPVAPPAFSVPLLSGKTVSLSDYKGKVVFLNFWATWCGPCRDEMPSMEVLYQRFKGRNFELLSVNCGENKGEVEAFIRRFKLNFPAALDLSGRVSAQYNITAIPATFIIDEDGRIVSRILGSLDWTAPEIIAAFDALLGG